MRLSEAIRLGAMQGPQVFGAWFGPNSGSCALGAACLAVGAIGKHHLIKHYPTLTRGGLMLEILELNDHQNWTRERIAAWLIASGNDCEMVPQDVPTTEEVLVCC